jgi:hypothetical protein
MIPRSPKQIEEMARRLWDAADRLDNSAEGWEDVRDSLSGTYRGMAQLLRAEAMTEFSAGTSPVNEDR